MLQLRRTCPRPRLIPSHTVPLRRRLQSLLPGPYAWTPLTSQAFGKVGVAGAVVVLGYNWKAGPQEQWGALLNKIIEDFAAGACPAVLITLSLCH